jgi:hypothetical protein
MFKRSALLLLLASICSAAAFAQRDGYAVITDQRVHLIAKQASEELNKQLPMTINSETRGDTTIVGPGRRFTYLLTDLSNFSKTETSAQIENEFGSSIRNKVCTTNALKLLVDSDYLITYKYFDVNGRFIGDIAVKRQDCIGG